MKNCKTCKYWNRDRTVQNGVSDCDMEGEFEKGDKAFFIDVFVHDDSGMSVKLMTGENFGCVHHTEK